jgi:hypothetical protein
MTVMGGSGQDWADGEERRTQIDVVTPLPSFRLNASHSQAFHQRKASEEVMNEAWDSSASPEVSGMAGVQAGCAEAVAERRRSGRTRNRRFMAHPRTL